MLFKLVLIVAAFANVEPSFVFANTVVAVQESDAAAAPVAETKAEKLAALEKELETLKIKEELKKEMAAESKGDGEVVGEGWAGILGTGFGLFVSKLFAVIFPGKKKD